MLAFLKALQNKPQDDLNSTIMSPNNKKILNSPQSKLSPGTLQTKNTKHTSKFSETPLTSKI